MEIFTYQKIYIYKYIEMEIPSHLRFILVKDLFPYTLSIYRI